MAVMVAMVVVVGVGPSQIISLLPAVRSTNANQGPTSCYVIIYRSSRGR